MTFQAPSRDLLFSLRHAAGLEALLDLPRFRDFDIETAEAVLEAAGAFATGVLAPLNRSADLKGAVFENGRVRAPAGFGDAYAAYRAGGWSGLAAAPELGGQGLPKAVALAVFEMVHAANMAFGLCPMLSEAAIEALTLYGDARQREIFLPRLVSGEWTGTMNLTEPQAGSDLSLLACRADPDGAGGYRLTGQKIYITWGDHDLTENICHLVLARLPDAPPGVRGISLFLAPKRLVDADGGLGVANALRPASIEHKLGIHGSPTCVMLYEGASAELVGRPNEGLAHMFTMMNAARINVGAEGVGIAERAYQGALAYALDRRQGRSPFAGEAPARIFDHPDVRRMLMVMKSKIEAARGICLSTAAAGDLAREAPAPEERSRWALREELLTPIAKAWSTDVGVEAASLGLQIFGGMGFIEETGAAQHYRDARIAPIYEGTNGIQAIDLAGRKLSLENGRALGDLLDDVRKDAETLTQPALETVRARLLEAAAAAEAAGAYLREGRGSADALAGASSFMALMGVLTGGWMLAKGARAALGGAKTDPWLLNKVRLARFFADHELVKAQSLAASARAGGEDLADLAPESLAS